MGLALWHFTVFLPDRCWSGIIGAFLGCVFGAIIFGLVIHGFAIPGQDGTDLITALEGVPGAAIGYGLMYWAGARQEATAHDRGRAARDVGVPVALARTRSTSGRDRRAARVMDPSCPPTEPDRSASS